MTPSLMFQRQSVNRLDKDKNLYFPLINRTQSVIQVQTFLFLFLVEFNIKLSAQ